MSSYESNNSETLPAEGQFDSRLLLTSFVLTSAGCAMPEHSKAQNVLFGLAAAAYAKVAFDIIWRQDTDPEPGLNPEADREILRQHNSFGEL